MAAERRTIAQLAQALRSRDVTAAAVTDAVPRGDSPTAIPRSTPSSPCSPTRRATQARRADDEIAAGRYRGPLHGVPISLKDLIDVEGTPTTAASRVRDGHVAGADAPVVTRLREAGAVFDRQDQPPRVRARHHQRGLGVRAGAASARSRTVARWIVRRLGGVGPRGDGLRVDRHRHRRIDPHSVGRVRPGRAEADDRRDLYRRRRPAEHDARPRRAAVPVGGGCGDRLRRAARRHVGSTPAAQAPDGLRLGVLARLFHRSPRSAGRFCVRAARPRGCARRASRCEDVSIAHAGDIAPIYVHIVLAEAAAYHAKTLESRADDYTPNVRQRLEMGRYILAEDYVRALRGRDVLIGEVDAALPTAMDCCCRRCPSRPTRLGVSSVRLGGADEPVRNITLRLTQLFNVTGHPAITIPCGSTPEGLPIGAQLVGRRGATARLLDARAHARALSGPGNVTLSVGAFGRRLRRNVGRRRRADVRRRRVDDVRYARRPRHIRFSWDARACRQLVQPPGRCPDRLLS